jgi:hypothetical protein
MTTPVLQYPQVNGAKFSFCSLEFKLAGGYNIAGGVKSINYKDSLEMGKVWGNSSTLMGTTRGRNESTGDIELYADAADALMEIISLGGTRGYSETRFTFTVGYAELYAGLVTSDVLPQVRFHSMETSGSEGVEAITKKFQMQMLGQIGWHAQNGVHRVALLEAPIIVSPV